MTAQVFKLRADFDRRGYRGLESPGSNVLLSGTVPKVRRSKRWRVTRVGRHWTPPKVNGNPAKRNDYPCLDLVVPAFSGRAVAALADLLVPNGEILPLRTRTGAYFAYYVTKVADVLDDRRSTMGYAKVGVTASYIWEWAFVAERLSRLAIFRIPQEPSETFVTDRFVVRVEQATLSGFVFEPLWSA